MRLQMFLALTLITVFFSGASFAKSGSVAGAVNFNSLDKVSSQLHNLDNNKAKAVEVSKKNAE